VAKLREQLESAKIEKETAVQQLQQSANVEIAQLQAIIQATREQLENSLLSHD
jgi:hypothetical protein